MSPSRAIKNPPVFTGGYLLKEERGYTMELSNEQKIKYKVC